MADIIMPKMSDAMEEGKVLRWIKQPGDQVEKGEPVAEIETDKANVELEAPESGVLQEIKAQEGDSVPIGTPIAIIAAAGAVAGVKGGAVEAPEKPSPPIQEEAAAEIPEQPVEQKAEEVPSLPKEEQKKPERPPSEAETDGIKASPLARKIAMDAGVDLKQIKGTGPGGRIVEADVRDFIERGGKPKPPEQPPVPEIPAPPPAPHRLEAGEIDIGHIWESAGKLMKQSKQQTPHFYVTMEVDMEEAMRVRQWLNSVRTEDRQISLNDMVIKACAAALLKHPAINASYVEGSRIRMYDSINIGIAVAIPEGLIAPVIRNCESKSLSQISDEARDLIARTRKGEIRPEEYSGGTFTITNLGMYGVDEFSAIIVPPQAAILAVGAAIARSVVIEDTIEVRHTMKITVSADHRVTDGARVAEFMKDIKQALEQPMSLLE